MRLHDQSHRTQKLTQISNQISSQHLPLSLKIKRFSLLLVSLLLCHQGAQANVEVPIDELAQESVLPVFDRPQSVKNRNVTTAKRIDVGLFGGMALTEPIYDTTKFGVNLNYHFTELHSLGLIYTQNSTGLSKDGQGLKDSNGLDFNRAPKPVNSILLDYNFKPYYGKMSLSKSVVFNTTIYGSLALGMFAFEHKSYPGLAVGFGERFYITNALSFKVDFRVMAHQAPIPFYKKNGSFGLADGTNGSNGGVPLNPPPLDTFSERLAITTNLELGLNYLF